VTRIRLLLLKLLIVSNKHGIENSCLSDSQDRIKIITRKKYKWTQWGLKFKKYIQLGINWVPCPSKTSRQVKQSFATLESRMRETISLKKKLNYCSCRGRRRKRCSLMPISLTLKRTSFGRSTQHEECKSVLRTNSHVALWRGLRKLLVLSSTSFWKIRFIT
jgi:hypothetical protein